MSPEVEPVVERVAHVGPFVVARHRRLAGGGDPDAVVPNLTDFHRAAVHLIPIAFKELQDDFRPSAHGREKDEDGREDSVGAHRAPVLGTGTDYIPK
jgi:hypothetical protein